MRENKICIIKLYDDDFILIDELHKELNSENILLLFTKEKSISNKTLIEILKKEEIKALLIPHFFEEEELNRLKENIKIPFYTYNQVLDYKKTLVLTKTQKLFNRKNLYFEKVKKLNYDFLYRIKVKYEKVDKIFATFYLTDLFIEKIENTLNAKVYPLNRFYIKLITKGLTENRINNLSKEIGTIEFEEF